ncbi:dynein regulatory complex protein 9 isoform X1 [Nilaparvata lugens]|uniref:dynein regulatory complex protein 9 isoform X1 n=1 Tax=Nilaparvata lugens TaxID=108931 RepID=UPI00193EB7EF|nr:dynein regulatory complex protein 9 isoform X1 [Nilaparvata lugens]
MFPTLTVFEKTVINTHLQNCSSQMKLLSCISAGNKICIEKTLERILDELNETDCGGECLKTMVDELGSKNRDQCEALKVSIEQLKEAAITLQREISDISAESGIKIKRMDVEASTLKDDLENASFQQEVEIKYTEKWEAARAEQNLTIASIEEARLTKMLRVLQYRIDFEERVHTEITMYLEQTTLKFEEDLKAWMQKYDEQMNLYDRELLDIKEKRGIQLEKLNSLTKKFHDHARKIKEYKHEKEERIRESALKEHLNKTTTKIQAWWRGVMVRRHLGPYKKKGKVKERPKFKGKSIDKADTETKGKAQRK